MRKITALLLSISFILALACSDNSCDNLSRKLASLQGKEFVFVVDRIANSPEALFPKDELDETNYIQSNEMKAYTVSFSDDGNNILVEPGSIKGKKVKTVNKSSLSHYDIAEGAFAGGRVILWSVKEKLQAELTIYGSGKPILSSERGLLVVVE